MTLRWSWLGSLLIPCVLVGCVKKDGGLSDADAKSAGQALASEVEDGSKGYGSVSNGAALDAPCATLSGDTADPDLDSIPNSATLTYNCTDAALGYTGTLTGTMMVTDNQPNVAAWAFTGTANLHASLTGPAGASIVTDRTGTITATQGSLVGPFALERTLDVMTVLTGDLGRQTKIDETNAWTLTYTPQATWTPGGVVISGTLTAVGSWSVTVGAAAADATLATPTPLTLAPACASRVTAGTVTASYMDGTRSRTITVTWTGCGASTVTVI